MGENSEGGKKWIIIVGLIFLSAGLGLTTWELITYSQAVESINWPTTLGTVIDSYIDEDDDDEGGITYYAIIEYEYQVEGVSYVSNSFTVGGTHIGHSYSEAKSILDDYPIGNSVRVHYDPNNPSNCALRVGVKLVYYLILFIGIIFALVGALVTIGIIRDDKTSETNTSQDTDLLGSELISPTNNDAHTTNTSIPHCDNCGTSNPMYQNFCHSCGERVQV